MERYSHIKMFQKIVVVGLGYVGIPVAAKFAEAGVKVVGIDVDERKIEELNKGNYPLKGEEPGLKELIKEVVNKGFFKATLDYKECKDADAILVTVQTPFDSEKMEPDYTALESAIIEIGKNMGKNTLVVVESTIAPTTMYNIVKPLLEKYSGLIAGEDFYLGHCPERVMPGKLLYNLVNIGRVVGGINKKSCKRMIELYGKVVKGELCPTDMLTAEICKTVENAYRDVQIAFANEVALICEKLEANAYKIRELVNRIGKRNMHFPGGGVGGHCIPKDGLLLAYSVKDVLNPKLLLNARKINDYMPIHVAELVEKALKEANKKIEYAHIAILGASYLPNTGDTRNSPTIKLIRELEKKEAKIKIHDPYVDRLGDITVSKEIEEVVENSDCLIVMTAHDVYHYLALKKIKTLMKTPVIVDGRNLFSKSKCEKEGFTFYGVGK